MGFAIPAALRLQVSSDRRPPVSTRFVVTAFRERVF
jgi:hypothetical protein